MRPAGPGCRAPRQGRRRWRTPDVHAAAAAGGTERRRGACGGGSAAVPVGGRRGGRSVARHDRAQRPTLRAHGRPPGAASRGGGERALGGGERDRPCECSSGPRGGGNGRDRCATGAGRRCDEARQPALPGRTRRGGRAARLRAAGRDAAARVARTVTPAARRPRVPGAGVAWRGPPPSRSSMSIHWRRRLTRCRGSGPRVSPRSSPRRGLTTVEDLVWLVPRRYDDVRDARPLAEVIGLARRASGRRFAARGREAARMVFARGRRWAEVRLGSVERSETGGGDPRRLRRRGGGQGPPPPPSVGSMSCSRPPRWCAGFNVFAGHRQADAAGQPGSTLSGRRALRGGGRLELANPDILAIELETTDAAADARAAAAGDPGALPRRGPACRPGRPARPGVARRRCVRVAGLRRGTACRRWSRAAAGLPGLAETLGPAPRGRRRDTSAEDLAALSTAATSRWQRRLAVRRAVRARRGDHAAPPASAAPTPPRCRCPARTRRWPARWPGAPAVRADRRAAPHDRRDRG